ncbi:MAG: tRNA lysidine(34) synthetase TilS [Lachnospiraceae bacterium]|nr:tRNA lysidine(34) synthetase TilS [Lachnospiraceae bacterium]
MCLLFLLYDLREKLDFSLSVVHVEHGIRGEEALRDADLVRRVAGDLGLAFQMKSFDVPSLASKLGQSLEEAGRAVRYRTFEALEADRIAIAHHAEDAAETLLFNLFRGTGIRGMGSIRPVRGKIIRPILRLTRPEIESYLRENDIPYCQDSTNSDNRYSRNRIRNKILPEAVEINENAIMHLFSATEKLQQADQVLTREADRLFREFTSPAPTSCLTDLSQGPLSNRENEGLEYRGPLELSLAIFDQAPPILTNQVILRCISELAGKSKDISEIHLEETASLRMRQSGSRISLPYGITAMREFDKILFQRDCPEGKNLHWNSMDKDPPLLLSPPDSQKDEIIPLPENGRIALSEGGQMVCSLLQIPESADITVYTENKIYTKSFDYVKIENTVVLRTRRPGDRITLKGGSKKLKDLFIEAKIPIALRDRIYVIAEGNQILWIPGLRMGEAYKVKKNSRKIWQLELLLQE